MKYQQLKEKSASELTDVLLQSKKEAMNLRFRKAAGDMPSTARFKQLRKIVARIKTIMNQNISSEVK
jgi:large subunit ribosomal protein L29